MKISKNNIEKMANNEVISYLMAIKSENENMIFKTERETIEAKNRIKRYSEEIQKILLDG